MLRLLPLVLAWCLSDGGVVQAAAQPADETRRVIYSGATLIDGAGGAPRADIANMRNALFTVQRGHRLDRSDFRPTDEETTEGD